MPIDAAALGKCPQHGKGWRMGTTVNDGREFRNSHVHTDADRAPPQRFGTRRVWTPTRESAGVVAFVKVMESQPGVTNEQCDQACMKKSVEYFWETKKDA